MNLVIDHPEAVTPISGRLRRAARTTVLLMGGSFASVFMVELPTPLGSNSQAMAQSPVPASEKWIPLGTAAPARSMNGTTAVDPGATPTSEEERQRSRRKPRGVQLASLGRETGHPERLRPNLFGGGVRWNASSACLNTTLRRVLGEVAANFGSVTVNSTCRNHDHNARVGGAKHSQHLTGNAADFRIGGNPGTVLAFLNSNRSVGGLKHYGGGVFHIDTGPRRTW